VASKTGKLHGRIEGAARECAVPGCCEPGEFKAPLAPSGFDGPGAWRLLCLEHVRQHNSKYNYFEGMSADEISEAQRPLAGWERPSRRFAHAGADPSPAWSDFNDPLDAIAAHFRRGRRLRTPRRQDLVGKAARHWSSTRTTRHSPITR